MLNKEKTTIFIKFGIDFFRRLDKNHLILHFIISSYIYNLYILNSTQLQHLVCVTVCIDVCLIFRSLFVYDLKLKYFI